MPQYKAPLRDMRFVLYDLLDIEQHYARMPGASDLNREVLDAMLDEAAKLVETVIAPLNAPGDAEGCHWSAEGVRVPKGFKDAYKQYYEAGLGCMTGDTEFGGQGLPASLQLVVSEMTASANNSFCMYPGLTNGAIACIREHGTPEQKQAYLPRMISGEWSGTMCLTEAHCGTDLGILRTKAVPNKDGSFNISGEKIFISAGEHDMSNNIVHLVLARLPDAPPGTKGISLFIVPKFLPAAGGGVGERNAVRCASIEHKMGIKASATCVIVFEDAKGFLVGQPHKGLRAMFTMMNVARLGTGMQGMSQGAASFQGAVEYARERLQMRALTGPKAPDKPADPIIVHPDVRRMLLTQKAFAEGSRALAFYCGMLADIVLRQPGSDEAERAESLMELLTPICKAFMTDTGYESSNLGMQVFGGHGYIREHGMEQLVRDGRILQQYEGTNGIQALDLLGRKVLGTGGASLRQFTDEIDAFCAQHEESPELAEFVKPLDALTKEWRGLVNDILQLAIKNPDEAGAASYDFLSYSGYVTYAYLFARMADVSFQKLKAGVPDPEFYKAKIHTARFFFQRLLPRTRGLVVTMLSGAGNLMDLPETDFWL
ncbi:MAG TPA: acyl-CoA dehydrogenase C-terminal domain-containing protein [Polyangiales bacterium]|nr:acyl-CoA dehydrogenase C-terminal domain-containing protein [Polyangiales bacterium]